MKEYVKQKFHKNFILILAAITIAGMHIWWQGSPAPVFAQSFEQINVTLSLFDVKNEPINGSYQVRFALYTTDRIESDPFPSNADASSRLWEETQEIEVRNGILRAYLGSVTSLPAGIFSDATRDYYLGIRIGDDSEIVPRKKIAAVPYALNAGSAGDARTLAGAAIGTKSGNVPVLGKSGKFDIKLLPTGTGTKQLVLGNDGRLHDQNTDTGTDATEFNIGSGSALGSENFSLSVSSAAEKPSLRYNSSTNEWELSNDGTSFSQISTGSSTIDFTSGVTGVLPVGNGGTGAATLAANGVLLGNGASAVTAVTGTDAQFLVADSGGVPTFVSLSGDATITNAGLLSIGSGAVTGAKIADATIEEVDLEVTNAPTGLDGYILSFDEASGGFTWIANTGGSGSSKFTDAGTFTYLTSTTDDLVLGSSTADSGFFLDVSASTIRFEGVTADTFETTIGVIDPTADRAINFPDVSGTVVTTGNLSDITAVGTIASGTWNGTLIGTAYGGTGTSTQFTQGSIVFAGASGVYSQDNTNFFWDDTNDYLGLGYATPAARLDITGNTTDAVLGSEMITSSTDRDFTGSLGNWTAGSNWAYGTNNAAHTAGTTGTLSLGNTYLSSAPVAGGIYQVTFFANTTTVGTLTVSIGGVNGGAVGQKTGTDSQTQLIIATDTSALTFTPDAAWAGTLDSISVKRITPSNATQIVRNSDNTIGLEIRAGGTGLYNAFIGTDAGLSNTTGNYNAFFGYESGASNITGGLNTFVGFQAGYSNTVGTNDTFLGRQAGANTTTGSSNTFVGSGSGFANVSGSYNSFIGTDAGLSNTTGGSNSFLGWRTGYSNTTGSYNTFLGNVAGFFNTTGSYNAFFGGSAGGANTTGEFNTFVGISSGYNNSTSSYNTALGYQSGSTSAPGGDYNVTLGYAARTGSTVASSIVLGYNALSLASNQLVIGSGNSTGITQAYFGQGVNLVSPVGVTINATGGLGTNNAGAPLTIAGGKGTGNASGGSLIFATSDAGASGSTLQSLSTKATLLASGNFGIGDTTPASLFTVGNGDLFQVNSSGVIAAATGITSSGTITFSGLSTAGIVTNTAGGVLGTTSTIGVTLGGTGTSTQFTQGSIVFAGASGVYSQDNTNFFWDDTNDYLGIGYNTPAARLDIAGDTTTASIGSEMITSSTNRDFTGSLGNWTAGSNWAYGTNNATHTAGTTGTLSLGNAYLSAAPVAGGIYQIVFTTNTTTAGTITPSIGGVSGVAVGQATGANTQTQVIVATGAGALTFTPSPQWAGTLDNISVKRITPSNATQIVRNSDNTIGLEIRAGGTGLYNSFLGVNAGLATTTGNYNSFLGAYAGSDNTTGSDNSFLGFSAGSDNTTGSDNTFLGAYAGSDNTTGSDNTFLGAYAGSDNTTGSWNIFLGSAAGRDNTTGGSNAFIGESAGAFNTTGGSNVFIGKQAGYVNETGSNNIFLGNSAGSDNDTGSSNAYLGSLSGLFNSAGSSNVFLGYLSGLDVEGSYSTIIGAEAFVGGTFFSEFQAVNNTVIGYRAGYSAATGADNNILLGYQAADNITTGANNIVIGYDVDLQSASQSNTLNIGNLIFGTGIDGTGTTLSAGNVGIGDTTPAALLTVGNGDLFRVNSTGAIAAATGITSSGTITFSGLSTAGIVTNTAGGVLGTTTGVPIANGGTNATTIGSAGSIPYSTGSAYAFSAVGTAGQALISGGTGAPTWSTLSGGSITADSLDFSEFKDALTLDAATDIALGALTLSTSGTGAVSFGNTGLFTVAGNIDFNGTGINDIAGTLNLSGNALTSSGALTVTPAAGSNFNIVLSTTGDFVVNTDQFYIDTSTGYLGIGYNAPAARLDISGNTTTAVEGSEQITALADRDFSGAGNWSGTNWTVGSGVATHTAGANAFTLAASGLDPDPVAGGVYQITFTTNTTTDGTLAVSIGGTSSSNMSRAIGTDTQTQVIVATDTSALTFTPDATWAGTLDDISVVRITPSNATQIVRNSDNTIGLEIRAGGTSDYGTFIGVDAGRANTSGGNYGTFIGYQAGASNINGDYGTFIGSFAGSNNTTGSSNSFVGRSTGRGNTTGSYNSFFGDSAGNSNSIGNYNAFLGYYAGLFNTSGHYNAFIGSFAGMYNSTGTGNSFFGTGAGQFNVTGSYNLYLGYGVEGDFTTNSSIGIGYETTVTANNQLVIGSAHANGSITDAYFGQGVTKASPAGITINATGGLGTNNAGAPLTIAGGKGTGNASGGSLIFQTSNAGASGTTLQSLSTKATLLASGNFGIGDTTPASLFTVGSGDLFNVNTFGDVTSTFSALDGSTTANGGGTDSTTLILTSATDFNVGNYILVNSTYAKITNIATNTLTISPALTWSNGAAVTEYHIPEIGATGLASTLTNRYGRGYFIDGIVSGNGTTYYTEHGITSSAATFDLLTSGVSTLNIGDASATVTISGSLEVSGASAPVFAGLSTNGVVYTSGGTGTLNTEAQLALSRGGTNKNVTPSAGAVFYSDTESFELTAVGVSGQVLISGGTGAPTWSTISGSAVTADSLDFTEFEDILDLDSALTLNQGSNTWTQNFTGTSGTGLEYNANSLTTGSAVNIAATNTATANTAFSAIQFNLTNAQATSANTNGATGLAVNFTNNPTIAGNTEYAVRIQNQLTANTTDNAVAALLLLDNADSTASGTTLVSDAILITNSGGSGYTNFLNTPTLDISAAGAITGATGITSSGTITFSGLSTAGIVTNTAGGVLGTTSTIGVTLGGTGTSTQFTPGSIVFAGASGVYSQDNTNFFWDDTNNRLGLGDATPDAKLDIDFTQTSGTVFGVAAPSSVTLAGTLTGFNLNLSSNVTANNQSLTGASISLPAVTNSTGIVHSYYGLDVTGGAITSSGSQVNSSTGVNITNANVTQSAGSAISTGLYVTTGSITSGGGQRGIYINPSGVSTGTLRALYIGGITAGGGTETAIEIGSGWDTILNTGSLDISGAGVITGATGITSSGTITFSGLSTAGIVTNTAGGVLGTTTSVPIANGGTNATTIGSAGSIPYSTGSAYAFSAVGTAGQALISGGTGAPTFYAPTAGSILFAGTSGILEQDNASLFFDNTNNYLGLGDATPDSILDILSSSAAHTYFTIGNTNAGSYNPALRFELTENSPLFSLGIDDSDSDKFKIYAGSDISGTSQFTMDSTGSVSIANLNLGAASFDTDAGMVSWVDMPVTSSATAGTVESYTAQIDGNALLTVYAESDGAGSIRNSGISIGNSTLQSGARFAVTQTSTSTTAGTTYGTYNSVSDTGIVTTGTDTTYGAYTSITRTGATGGTLNTYGTYVDVTADLAGSGAHTVYGGYFSASHGDNVIGVTAKARTGMAATSVTALQADTYNDGTVTDVYGIHVTYDAGGFGSGTNAYGLYLDDAINATNDYGIYQAGSNDDNYFAGNVGIGTATPTSKVDIVGTAGNQLRLADNATNVTNKNAYITARHYTNAEENLALFVATSASSSSTVSYGGGSGSLNTATELRFYTAANNTTLTGTQRMTIDSSGNVGLGDTTPASLLTVGNGDLFQVNSSGAIAAATGITSSGTITFSGLNNAGGILFTDGGGTLMQDTTNFFWDDTNNRLGIGYNAPAARLDIAGDTTTAVEGSEQITALADRDFSGAGNWSGTNWTVGSGVATHTAGANAFTLAAAGLDPDPVAGGIYQVTFTTNTTTVGSIIVSIGGTDGVAVGQSTGTNTQTQVITATDTSALTFTPDATWAGTLDDISVVRITPSNATQIVRNSDNTIGLEIRAGGTGLLNTFVGANSGRYNTTGSYNSFFGYQSGGSNTTGSYNNFFGNAAGYSNTTGTDNTFFGTSAGSNNTTGSYNAFFGNYAGLYNTIGEANSFFGYAAGSNNTTGSYNSFIGYQSGGSNTTGSYNNFLGNSAGSSNTTGSSNTFLGTGAGYLNETGTQNTFVGESAGWSNTTGSYNTFVGSTVGYDNTGSYNTYLGTVNNDYGVGSNDYSIYIGYSTESNGAYDSSIGIGYDTMVTASNQLVIGSSDALGSITQAYFGQGVTKASPAGITINATGGSGTDNAGAPLTIAGGKGTGNASGGSIIFQTSNAGVSGTTLQSLSTKATLLASGNFGIGDTTPSYKLEVNADVSTSYVAQFFNDGNNADRYGIQIQGGADDASGTTYYINALDGDGGQVGYIANTSGTFALTDVSDIRTKTNIEDTSITSATGVISDLRVVDFNRRADPNGPRITGFIAQEVEAVYPAAITTGPTGLLGIMKDAFIPLLVKAVQEQQIALSGQEADLATLSLRTDQSVTTLGALQASVDTQLTLIGDALAVLGADSETTTQSLTALDSRVLATESATTAIQAQVAGHDATLSELETQMATLADQNAALIEFFNTFELGNVVAKDQDGNVDLLGGKIRARLLETGGIVIENTDEDAPTIGTTTIYPVAIDTDEDGNDDWTDLPMSDEEVAGRDGKSVRVMTDAMIPMITGSQVFTSFGGNPGGFSWIEKYVNGDGEYVGFDIKLSEPAAGPIAVDWWLVERK